MQRTFLNILVVLLSGCSLIVEPEYPPKTLVTTDTGFETDTAQTDAADVDFAQDATTPDISMPDAVIENDVGSVEDATVDAEVEAGRRCLHWNECYSGEYCAIEEGSDTGSCLPGLSDEQCALMNDDTRFPGPRWLLLAGE